MIKFKKINIDRIKNDLPKIKEIFKNYPNLIDAAYLFGSFHKGNTTSLSDIDIAVLFNSNICKEEMDKIESRLYEDLSKTLKTDEIDLINLNNSPLSVQYGVLKDKEILYYSNRENIIDFENMVILQYLDFKPYRDELNRAFLKALKEVKI